MDGRVFLPSVYQSITAPKIAGRSGFRWIGNSEFVIWALSIIQCCFLATAFSVDLIFYQMFTLLTYQPMFGGVDFVPQNETDTGVILILSVGLWKIYYSRAISAPKIGSSFQMDEAHYTVLKTISDTCISSGIRVPFVADSARIMLGIAQLFIFCNFITPLFSRRAFIFTVFGSGFTCLYGMLMMLVWLTEILHCTKQMSLNRPFRNESQMLFFRTFDSRAVIPASSFTNYIICGFIFMLEIPFLVYKMRAQ